MELINVISKNLFKRSFSIDFIPGKGKMISAISNINRLGNGDEKITEKRKPAVLAQKKG